ncbi:MAG: hypothetical protein NC205_00960 [Prevotella sp.]|nr:hypothetical protein [Alistipes senegalensis]MCM1357133.1 hypothetical protein [Prevotella sp.]
MIKILNFTQGGVNASGEYDSTSTLRSDFAEIPAGTQKIQGVPKIVKKLYNSSLKNYTYSDFTGTPICYAYIFDAQHTFIAYFSAINEVDISAYPWAQYVRFVILISNSTLQPDDSQETTKYYYFLQSFDFLTEIVSWKFDENGEIFNKKSPRAPKKSMQVPYPAALWRLDDYSPNMPRHLLFPDFKPFVRPVKQAEYITVYSMHTEQKNFNNNGLAVLTPISCTVTENFNADWSVTLEHPKDSGGKWRYLVEFNILKVLGQLFVIRNVTYTHTTVTVFAEHIFYQLNDCWIYSGANIVGANGAQILSNILANSTFQARPEDTIYRFESGSDLTAETVGVDMELVIANIWQPLENGTTPLDLILGSGGFTDNFGGDLYRNNFYFSLNEHMENHLENSFDIRMGANLKKITQKTETAELCTHFTVFDQFGSGLSVFWEVHNGIPHHIVRSQTVNFGEKYTETDFNLLAHEARKYFGQNMQPKISYEISLEDLRNNPDFSEFSNNPRYNVGDRGRIFDEELNISVDAHIVHTIKDGISGKTLEIGFSSTGGFGNMGIEHGN